MKKSVRFRRSLGLLLALTLCLIFVRIQSTAAPVSLNGPDVFAKTYCVINGDTKEVLMSKEAETKMYPASTTKVLTALIVLENVDNLDQMMTFTETAINIDPSSSTLFAEGACAKAMVGEKMSVRDALYGMLLKSANECGAMLGEFVAGSEAAFAEMMNQKAAELGCVNSHFTNAYGIHNDNHYTCAYDLCLILQAAMENSRYRVINGTKIYTIAATNMSPERTISVGHSMLNGTIEEEGVIGGKTGSTPQAGKTLVTAVNRDGYYTISALMGSDAENMYLDEKVLLEYTYGIHDGTRQPVEWTQTNDYVVVKESVRMRYSPSLQSGVYGTAEEGATLQRLGTYWVWSRVLTTNGVYYINTQYLESTGPIEEPTSEQATSEVPTSETTSATVATETSSETVPSESQSSSESSATEVVSSTHESIEIKTTTPKTDEEKDMTPDILLDLLLILIPTLVVAILIAIWIVLFIRYKDKKNHFHGQ